MRKFLKRLVWTVLLLLIIGGVAGTLVYRSAQNGPEFYQQAMQADVSASSQASEVLEQKIVNLHNELITEDRWSVTFSEAQLNGWLAAGLPRRFAHMLPGTVTDPRISLVGDGMQIAFRYQDKRISGIVTLQLDAIVGERENEIGIVVRRLNAGVIPLPVSAWTDKITRSAARANIPLKWSKVDGDPVAWTDVEVHLPEQPSRALKIENVSVSEGLLHVSGTADGPVDVQQSPHGIALREKSSDDKSLVEPGLRNAQQIPEPLIRTIRR